VIGHNHGEQGGVDRFISDKMSPEVGGGEVR